MMFIRRIPILVFSGILICGIILLHSIFVTSHNITSGGKSIIKPIILPKNIRNDIYGAIVLMNLIETLFCVPGSLVGGTANEENDDTAAIVL